MLQPLQGKIITVIGSSGYLGQNIIRRASEYGAQVYGVSRRGYPPGYIQTWHSGAEWLRGDAMNPTTYQEILRKSDLVIHTVGTLVDSSVLQRRQPGEQGTYEQMNRDTLIKIADNIVESKDQKKPIIVYISGSAAPPFLHRYLTTKQEAEQYLLNLLKQGVLESVILRPGFIYSWKRRWWSIPLMYGVSAWRIIYQQLDKLVPQNTFFGRIFKEFNVDSCVKLDDMIDSALSSINKQNIGKCLSNDDMERIANNFRRNK